MNHHAQGPQGRGRWGDAGQLADLPLRGPLCGTCGRQGSCKPVALGLSGEPTKWPPPRRGACALSPPQAQGRGSLSEAGLPPHPSRALCGPSPLPPGLASGKCQREREVPNGRWQQSGGPLPGLRQRLPCRGEAGAVRPLQGRGPCALPRPPPRALFRASPAGGRPVHSSSAPSSVAQWSAPRIRPPLPRPLPGV